MEKQHNRGQDGAGMATIKLDMPVGQKYIDMQKSTSVNAIKDIFEKIYSPIRKIRGSEAGQNMTGDELKMEVARDFDFNPTTLVVMRRRKDKK